MIRPSFFYDQMKKNGVEFFTGVPDSLLKNLCAYITDNSENDKHIIASNEGCAIGLATGHHLATGKIPVVYMQNSGIGNAVNPLLSLADSEVYGIPILLVIGWRGEPNVHDEPQHIKQGRVTCPLLDTMEIPYEILPENEEECTLCLERCFQHLKTKESPFALIIRKNTFEEYKMNPCKEIEYSLSRENAIKIIVETMPKNTLFVSTTGMTSRELYEIREHNGDDHSYDFLTVGSMGHSSQIALGLAISCPKCTVCCIDGDGAMLMHTGGMSNIGALSPNNMVHIMINNGVHDSVGGQPVVSRIVDLESVAKSMGYLTCKTVESEIELQKALSERKGTTFIQVMVRKGNRKDLGRPKESPKYNKETLMNNIREMSQ